MASAEEGLIRQRTNADPRQAAYCREVTREGVCAEALDTFWGASGAAADAVVQPVQQGIAWLESHQNARNAWGNTYEFVDTCTVLDSLGLAAPGGVSLASGAAWLAGRAAESYEELARQVTALARLQESALTVQGLTWTLWAARTAVETDNTLPNYPEGGWGLAAGYATDCMTTAVALQALHAAGRAGGLVRTNQAVGLAAYNVHEWDIPADATRVNLWITVTGTTVHLRMAEGAPPMGGMGFTLPPGSHWIAYPDSGLPFTAGHNYIVVQNTGTAAGAYTLTAGYETPAFDTFDLFDPLDYLVLAQNTDGGWGLQRGGDSEFYTTLHVLQALLDLAHYDLGPQRKAGINYLKSRQLPGGAFGYDGTPLPYVTALAARVLVLDDGYPFETATQSAIAALRAMQQPDGSWAAEPYDTALAVLALWEHNQTPAVDAGPDQWVIDADANGQEDVTLVATASDVDGSIDSYVWTENGLEIATGSSPTVSLAVGVHEITLTVTDDQGKPASDSVTVRVSRPPQTILSANMDSDPGWTTEGLWQWGVPLGNDGLHGGMLNGPDPTSGCTGAHVYGYNLAGGYEDFLPRTALTTPPIDCTGYTDVSLRFCRWLNVEESLYDHASVEVSNDGLTWVTLFEHSGGTLIETSWSVQEYDLSGVADDRATVYIRWVMGPSDETWNYGGWNIDDVVITGVPSTPPSPPTLVSSLPADGHIDPRGDTGGISQIELTFDSFVRNTDGSPLSAAAFSMTSTSGAAPPAVQSVDATRNPLVLITLSGPLEAGHWATLLASVENQLGAEAAWQLDFGFLPCDVDQSGNTNISDATSFVAEFNGARNIELIDTNRSGNVNISDATVFSTLFRTQWSGRSLPARP
ncbi:MAG: hypothetical protein AMXMBFR13_37790 [Phycisphaerae bacterium]